MISLGYNYTMKASQRKEGDSMSQIALNTQSLNKLDKALKRINQRIAEYGKENQFGRDSNVYKQAIAPYEFKDLETFIGTSKSGNFKFNVAKIKKALASGEDHPELERVLNAVGYTRGKNGYLRKTKEGMVIQTVTELKKEWRDILDPNKNLTDAELKESIDQAVTLSDDFTDLIYEYQKTMGLTNEEMAERFPELYGKGTRGQLSKADYERIKSKMIRDLVDYKKEQREKAAQNVASYQKRTMANRGMKNS